MNTKTQNLPIDPDKAFFAEPLEPLEFYDEAAAVFDGQGRVQRTNARARTLFGPECRVGVPFADLCQENLRSLDGSRLSYEDSAFAATLKDGEQRRARLLVRDHGGRWRTHDLRLEAVESDGGGTLGVLCLLREVAEPRVVDAKMPDGNLQEMRRELLSAREASQRAVAAQSQFLANMSHEIRTPLNAVIGMAEVLWETDLSDEQREMLSVLMRGGRNLLGIITDVLDYSRLESGQLPLQETKFDLRESIAKVIAVMSPQAARKGLTLECELQSELGLVRGDAKKLDQILLNIVGNAIKFTEHGGVNIRVSAHGPHAFEVGEQVLFEVTDTGIGMSDKDLGLLFQRFTQCEMDSTKSYGGTGLGLAISKQLIELMGGSVWVESREGVGSTFHFTCRLPHVEENAGSPARIPTPSPRPALDGLRILVVEDSEDNQFLIANFLNNIDGQIDFANNGQEALSKFKSNVYDLVLMDMQMPVMDGYSATRWIRILEKRHRRHVPIIALTAYALATEVKKSLDAGCDAHLNKPISKKQLLETIARYAGVDPGPVQR